MLYWTSWNQPAIHRTSLDSRKQKTIIDTNLGAPFALAIDFAGNFYDI